MGEGAFQGAEEGEILVKFVDFGNEEPVRQLYRLPQSISTVAPLAVQVSVEGMMEVPDTEKNRRRVERKLDEEVSVVVNLKGVAKFFKGEDPILFIKKEVSDEEKTNNVTRSSKLT